MNPSMNQSINQLNQSTHLHMCILKHNAVRLADKLVDIVGIERQSVRAVRQPVRRRPARVESQQVRRVTATTHANRRQCLDLHKYLQ